MVGQGEWTEDWYLESNCSEHPLCETSLCWAPALSCFLSSNSL